MKEKLVAEVQALAELFDRFPREGTEVDEPEGSRYIRVSHTMARRISGILRRVVSTNRAIALTNRE